MPPPGCTQRVSSQATWLLSDGGNDPAATAAADTASSLNSPYLGNNPLVGQNPATLSGAATWTNDATRGQVLNLDGTTGAATTSGPVLNTTGGGQTNVHASTAAALNTWTHLVGTYNTATHTMTLYVNGTSAGSVSYTTPWNATGPLDIGHAGTGDYFPGMISNAQAGDNLEAGLLIRGGDAAERLTHHITQLRHDGVLRDA